MAIITLTKVRQDIDRPGQAGAVRMADRAIPAIGQKQLSRVFTPAMIKAGVSALNAHVSDEYRILPDEEIVEKIVMAVLDRRSQGG